MKLSIIIISYNTRDLLKKCLISIYDSLFQAKFRYEVIVVDNGSTDGSDSYIKNQISKSKNTNKKLKIKLIKNKENLGFARANNQGIRKAKGEYILLLNSDTEVKDNAIEALIDVAEKDKNIGVVGPKLVNPDGSLQPSVGYFPTIGKIALWMMFFDDIPYLQRLIKPYHVEYGSFYQKKQQVDWVTGACMLIRRSALKESGVFDEKIFMYGDEVELCFRIKRSGNSCFYTPEATVLHHKGASGEGRFAGIVEEYKFLEYFYKKYTSLWQFYLLHIFLYLGAWLRWVLFGIILRQERKANPYAKYLKMAG